MKFYKLTWNQLEKDCYKLGERIKDKKIDRILCISRGGLVCSRIFSDILDNLPISHLTVSSYQDLKQQKETKITETPTNIKDEVLLVVDEIADSGKTVKIIDEYLRSLKITKFYTLAPYIRSFTNPKPDFYLKVIDDWIIFPYEVRETEKALKKLKK